MDTNEQQRLAEIRERLAAVPNESWEGIEINSHEDVPFLLSLIERLEEENKRYREALEKIDYGTDVDLGTHRITRRINGKDATYLAHSALYPSTQ